MFNINNARKKNRTREKRLDWTGGAEVYGKLRKLKCVAERNGKLKRVAERNGKLKCVAERNGKLKCVAERNGKLKRVAERNGKRLGYVW
ncbi:MAG: hypothetical protein ACRC4N_09125 [Gammaproteobacteria bacterium]